MKKLLFPGIAAALSMVLFIWAFAWAAQNRNYVTHLTGDEEVPPNVSRAQGQAILHLSKDGTELGYQLNVANIENVIAAHIHVGAAGVNGPVVVFLFGPAPAGGVGELGTSLEFVGR